MAKLLVYRGRTKETVFELRHGCVVGRARVCALQLDDRLVSRRHARFVRQDGAWAVEDMGANNGLYVNDDRVESAPLTPGDLVIAGQHVLVFEEGDLTEAETMVAAARRRKLMGPGSESTERLPQVRAEHLLERLAMRMRTHVVLIGADPKGVHLEQDRFTVGWRRDCDLVLPGRGGLLGRRPLELIRDARGTWFAHALSSMVIVKVNEERVQLDALADGDVIQVGVHSLRFHSAVLDPANEPVADGAMKSGRWPSRK